MDPASFSALKEILGTYGPLALGYPIAWILWRAYQGAHKEAQEMASTTSRIIEQNTNALNTLTTLIRERMK